MTLKISQNKALGHLTTLQIPAKAAYFAELDDITDLIQHLQDPAFQAMPKYVLGGGSNTVFCQDYPGLVLHYAKQGWSVLKENAAHVWLAIDAGSNWHECVMHTVLQGYGGIENLALIPGHVGAAPIQNIGAYGVELADVFDHLIAVKLSDGSIERFNLSDCEFAYRDSIFKSKLKGQYLITTVVLKLDKQPVLKLDYGNVRSTLAAANLSNPDVAAVANAVIKIRQSKLPDPKITPNAGSFFRNPIIPSAKAIELKQQFESMPQFATQDENKTKVSAAWLIEHCGWKGKQLGGCGMYDKHALVLVNHANANAEALKQLVNSIQHDVKSQFDIDLEPEVNLVE